MKWYDWLVGIAGAAITLAALSKAGARQPNTRKMKVSFMVFGNCPQADGAIDEYKAFVEKNSQLRLDITTNHYEELSANEQGFNPTGSCAFAAWYTLSEQNKAKILSGMQANIMIYHSTVGHECFGGGTWGGKDDQGNVVAPNAVPWVSLPYVDSWPNVGTVNKPGSALLHEFTNVLATIIEKTYPAFKSSERCTDFGFTEQNDPGWMRCKAYVYSTLTPEMIEFLYNFRGE